MKKSYSLKTALLLFAAAVLFASCGRRTVNIDDELPKLTKAPPKVTEPPFTFPDDEEDETEITEQIVHDMNDPDTEPHFRWGVWFAYSETESSYYFFEDDNMSGTKVNVSNGISTAFRYEKGEEKYTFHFDREDNNTPVAVEFPDFDHAVMTFPDNETEQLEYISSQRFSVFTFFTDEELMSMARSHFSRIETDKKKLKLLEVQLVTAPDSQAVIQLYIKLINPETGNEDVKVLETYTVNRTDACGTDSSGLPVDLSK